MDETRNDHEYGTGIEPLHHPAGPEGGEVDPATTGSTEPRRTHPPAWRQD